MSGPGRRRFDLRRPVVWGVLGAVLLLAGGSWYQALATPPYRYIDEQAHAGYVLAVQRGQLPTIDTPIDAAHGGDALRERLATEPPRRRDVWVANNPPMPYLVAAVPAAATRALGLPGGPLLGLRLVNVLATAAAVALAYLLGRDLAGGDRRVGLVTAGLLAVLPHVGFVAALGFNDGLALFATTGLLLALTHTLTPTPTQEGGAGERAPWPPGTCGTTELRPFAVLGLWGAIAASARPMALVTAVVAGVVALALTWGRISFARAALRVFGPMTVVAAWFYVLNIVRYGDPTGSKALLHKFFREPSGSIISKLRDNTIWESAFRTIATRRTDAPLATDPVVWFRVAELIAAAGVVATIVLVTSNGVPKVAQRLPGWVTDRTGGLAPRAWAAVTIVALVPMVLTAQHAAGGGNPHPRYLLPGMPVLAAAVALPLVRLAGRLAAGVVIAALAVLTAVQTRASIHDLYAHPTGPAGSALVTAYGNQVVRGLGPLAAGLGLVLLLVSLARTPSPHT